MEVAPRTLASEARRPALSRQIRIGHFRRQISPSVSAIPQQKQWAPSRAGAPGGSIEFSLTMPVQGRAALAILCVACGADGLVRPTGRSKLAHDGRKRHGRRSSSRLRKQCSKELAAERGPACVRLNRQSTGNRLTRSTPPSSPLRSQECNRGRRPCSASESPA